jgi:serine/threonine-protein kinase/endoribonuclease IRE1
MPRRRPPGEGHVVNNIFLLAAAVLFLPWLVNAQQQQRPGSGVRQRQESPHESLEASPLHTLEATKVPPQQVETPLIAQRRKNTISINERDINNDASAIATLAPAGSAVAAPSIKRPNTSSVGLSPPHDARSLKDWDVEDFVLLATVDGTLHARERKKGLKKWDLKLGGLEPMVQTTYYRRNRSSVEEDFETIPIDNYLWAIEPSRDGSIYIYQPGGPSPGLVDTGLTMKKLVDVMAPHWTEDPPVMYSGEKKTTMMTVDAETGLVIGHFSPTGAHVNQDIGRGNCKNTGFPSDECASNQVLTIGRTEYTVGIQGTKDGHQIATLRFFEWTPNSYDHDLSRQYHQTKDQKYIYAKHDGLVIGFHHETPDEIPRALFREKFDSPVVRVFDVGRHYTLQNSNPPLMILPQPLPPDMDDSTAAQRAGSIFLNHTEDGSWYAMSGKSYPLVDIQKPRQAQCMNRDWGSLRHTWDIMNNERLSEALVGLHSIEGQSTREQLLTISPPSSLDTPVEPEFQDRTPALAAPPSVIRKLQTLPQMILQSLLDFIKNPFWMIIGLFLMIFYKAQIKQQINLTAGRFFEEKQIPSFIKDAAEWTGIANLPTARVPTVEPINDSPVPPVVEVVKVGEDDARVPVVEIVEKDVAVMPALVTPPTEEVVAASPEKKKKRTHRGQRGGVKHKKGYKNPSPEASQILELSQDGNPPKPQPTVDDAVRNAQNMGQQTNLEPDIRTVPNDPSEVSGPVLRVGALECDTEQLIGTGSNGTMVFRGKFDGRDVAVKRMLIQFFDIASQETKLLRESDDHPNGRRFSSLNTLYCTNNPQSFDTLRNSKRRDFCTSRLNCVLHLWLM